MFRSNGVNQCILDTSERRYSRLDEDRLIKECFVGHFGECVRISDGRPIMARLRKCSHAPLNRRTSQLNYHKQSHFQFPVHVTSPVPQIRLCRFIYLTEPRSPGFLPPAPYRIPEFRAECATPSCASILSRISPQYPSLCRG
jgi:hypothetical protein